MRLPQPRCWKMRIRFVCNTPIVLAVIGGLNVERISEIKIAIVFVEYFKIILRKQFLRSNIIFFYFRLNDYIRSYFFQSVTEQSITKTPSLIVGVKGH